MTRTQTLVAGLVLVGVATTAQAQSLGTFRWQLQPFCNVVTLAITQSGSVFRLEGTDDQCGSGADQASVNGTAFQNPDGTIGFGLNVVTAPGGAPVHVDAEIALASLSGTWRDSAGASGTFVLSPGGASGGSPRPLPLPVVPTTIQLRADGGFVATGVGGAIPASGPGKRMLWYPGKSAFRVGSVEGDQWDDTNVGPHSVAAGMNSKARGIASNALGSGTTASGPYSTALGQDTTASGWASIAVGADTVASESFSTALGKSTEASANYSTAMGFATVAGGDSSTAMGRGTKSGGLASTATGFDTVASGQSSFAGGVLSIAGGNASLAFGNFARANGAGAVALGTNAFAVGNGSFVFADSTNADFAALGPNEFNVRASGGVQIFSNASASLGVALPPNATAWGVLSDARTKHQFRVLDDDDILAKIAAMPVTEWSYKAQAPGIRHMGPTAQDFYAAFALGEDPLRISTLDADGVALAAVRALEARTRAQGDRIAALERQLDEVLAALCALKDTCH